MKKSYLLLVTLIVSMFAYGQKPTMNLPQYPADLNKNEKIISHSTNTQKDLGSVVWSDDFSTPANWVTDNAGQTSPFGWTIDNVNDGWFFSNPINSTSGGNFAELYNGDPSTGSPAPQSLTYTMTTASSIDIQALTGTDQAIIQFEQYGAQFVDNQEIQVSIDGFNFYTVGSNSDIDPLTASGGSAYANPMTRSFDISNVITGNASTVWIRFSWSPGNQDITYGWFVDDVALYSKSDNDLQATASGWGSLGLNYYQIPLTQVAPVEFWAQAYNIGANTQYNSILNVDINGTIVSSPLGSNIPAMGVDSLVAATFTPTANGSYSFTWGMSSDSIDDTPVDNFLVGETFEVNDYIYARDEGGTPGVGGGEDNGAPGDFGFEAGNYFDCFADEMVYNIDVVIGSGTPDQTPIYGVLYVYDAGVGDFVFVENTDDYYVTSADASSNNTIRLPLFSPTQLTSGETYLVVVGCISEFYYGTSGSSDAQTSFILYGGLNGAGSQYYTTSTPMIRLDFQDFTGINEINSNINLGQNIPNPFNNNSTIKFNLKNRSDVQIEITDIKGSIISKTDLGNLNTGEHTFEINSSDLNSGMYYYSLISGADRITKKMIIQK